MEKIDNTKLFALVETIDYNNGETTAESEVHCIGTKEECFQKLTELRAILGPDLEEIQNGCYWAFTYDGGETHVFTIKSPI